MPAAQVSPPTKEIFIPCTYGTEAFPNGNHPGYRINADNEVALAELVVPHDFHSIREASIIWVAQAAVTGMAFDVLTHFAASGEAADTHSGSTTVTRTTLLNRLYRDVFSAALTGLAAGDHVGINVIRASGGNTNAIIIGVRLRYI